MDHAPIGSEQSHPGRIPIGIQGGLGKQEVDVGSLTGID